MSSSATLQTEGIELYNIYRGTPSPSVDQLGARFVEITAECKRLCQWFEYIATHFANIGQTTTPSFEIPAKLPRRLEQLMILMPGILRSEDYDSGTQHVIRVWMRNVEKATKLLTEADWVKSELFRRDFEDRRANWAHSEPDYVLRATQGSGVSSWW